MVNDKVVLFKSLRLNEIESNNVNYYLARVIYCCCTGVRHLLGMINLLVSTLVSTIAYAPLTFRLTFSKVLPSFVCPKKKSYIRQYGV